MLTVGRKEIKVYDRDEEIGNSQLSILVVLDGSISTVFGTPLIRSAELMVSNPLHGAEE